MSPAAVGCVLLAALGLITLIGLVVGGLCLWTVWTEDR